MRCIFAPPHHFVVPSPYKQGESAVRINIPHGSCTLYSVLYYLSVVLCTLCSVLLFYSFAIISAGLTRSTWWR